MNCWPVRAVLASRACVCRSVGSVSSGLGALIIEPRGSRMGGCHRCAPERGLLSFSGWPNRNGSMCFELLRCRVPSRTRRQVRATGLQCASANRGVRHFGVHKPGSSLSHCRPHWSLAGRQVSRAVHLVPGPIVPLPGSHRSLCICFAYLKGLAAGERPSDALLSPLHVMCRSYFGSSLGVPIVRRSATSLPIAAADLAS